MYNLNLPEVSFFCLGLGQIILTEWGLCWTDRVSLYTMVYKLGMSAQNRWRKLRGFHHLAKVIQGVKFQDGVQVDRTPTNNKEAGRIAV